MRFILLLLLFPLAAGGIIQEQVVANTLGSVAPPATVIGGDIGSPMIGASGTGANVVVTLPLVANDILRLESTDVAWQVKAELVSQSGWSPLESVTISLDDDVVPRNQIRIALGSVAQSVGAAVDVPLLFDTQVRVVGVGSGQLSFDLVFTPDGQPSPEIRYRVDLTT